MRGPAFLLLLLLLALAIGANGAPSANRISSLPLYPSALTFAQYSGYITVNQQHGRALFYWFVTSQNNPSSDPLMLWMQGGPGCSGLIGLLTENGPYRMNITTGGLQDNPFSWNRVANVLYIESPAGVGFSYSNTTTDYNTNNAITASDNYEFLRLWFQQFPEFQSNDFYLSGESYAGDYVPQLAQKIVQGPDANLRKIFKGFMIGNPVLSCKKWKQYSDTVQVNLFYYHGQIPITLFNKWKESICDGQSENPPTYCVLLMDEIRASIGRMDGDNIFQNFCTGNATLDITLTNPGCVPYQDIRNNYLNRADVQQAIHALKPAIPWTGCAPSTFVNYTTDWPDMLPLYRQFFALSKPLKIYIYSGDVDIATVPHAYTQLCLNELNSPIISPWRPYITNALQQVGGFIEEHKDFTFVTVKGAGHEVPQYAPFTAFKLLEHFLFNKTLPSI